MSTVVRCRPSTGEITHLVVSKGAPEVMHSRFRNAPPNYHRLYKSYAAKGGRIIALGMRMLDNLQDEDVSIMRGNNREAAESGLFFIGFAVFQCPIKSDSAPALLMLKKSSHRLVMITGDAPLTACNVAQHVHIVNRPVLILHKETSESAQSLTTLEDAFVWMNPEETERIPFDADKKTILSLAEEWDLCVTGEAFPFFEQKNLSSFILPLIQVCVCPF